jgi:hypothetical protein
LSSPQLPHLNFCDFYSQVTWKDVHVKKPHSVQEAERIQREISAFSRQQLHCMTEYFLMTQVCLEAEDGHFRFIL